MIWNQLAHRRGELLSDTEAPENVADRWDRRYDGRFGEINRWVEHVRATTYESIPYADPATAADGARVLLLYSDPNGDAEEGTGFVSLHSNDPTAANLYKALDRARLAVEHVLLWHVVPWWVSNTSRPPRSLLAEAPRARRYLDELVGMLEPAPVEVVLLGKPAAGAWDRLVRRAGLPVSLADAHVSRCPHPGPLVYARHDGASGRGNSDLIVETLRRAGQRARGEEVRSRVGGPGGRRRPF